MIDPRANPVAIRRHWALFVLRSIALLLILLGSINLLYAFGLVIVLQGPHALLTVWDGGNSWLAWAIALLVPGIAIVLLDRRLARWLVPVPRNECIQCGYTFRGLTSPRCPECGWTAGDGDQSAPPAAPQR